MMYKAVCAWRDLQDGHLYQEGDPFPHDGRAIEPERIETLKNGLNLASKPLIAEANETLAEEPKPRRNAKKAAKNEK